MDAFFSNLELAHREPNLWVKTMNLYSNKDCDSLREIKFRKGINVIWAHESDGSVGETGIERSGHGVGKTSFCLLLRYCLADRSKAIDNLRAELTNEFPEGGVAAVISIMGEEWSVYRPYAKHGRSKAVKGNDISILFDNSPTEMDFKLYEKTLSEKLLQRLALSGIPATSQTIEWQHLLPWLTRDQSARFMSFYHWREGEGSKFQRSREDPPILLRLVLGLLSDQEAGLLEELRQAEQLYSQSTSELAKAKRKPQYAIAKVEAELRKWGNCPESMPMHSGDLFNLGVCEKVQEAAAELEIKIQTSIQSRDALDNEVEQAAVQEYEAKKQYEIRKNSFDIKKAVATQNANDLQSARNRKDELLGLQGICPVCNLLFSQCSHVKEEAEKLDFRNHRDQQAFSSIAQEYAPLLTAEAELVKAAEINLNDNREDLAQRRRKRNRLQTEITELAYRLNKAKELLAEFDFWSKQLKQGAESSELGKLESKDRKYEQQVDSLNTKIVQLREIKSQREKRLSNLVAEMSKLLLGEGSFGYFDSFDDEFPFRLVIGCEAYKVLSVLLGDFAVLLFSLTEDTAFPDFLMHDCPREADMSEQLYRSVLELLLRIEVEIAGKGEPPFQYFLTTTTPPPKSLCVSPYVRLELLPGDEESLLFKRRFNSLRQEHFEV